MPLKKIEDELYERETDIEERRTKEDALSPQAEKHQDTGIYTQNQSSRPEIKPGFTSEQKKTIKIGIVILGIFTVLIVLFVLVVFYRDSSFKEENVTMEITGTEVVENNQAVEYVITFANNNRARLRDAEIILNHTENFQPNLTATKDVTSDGKNRTIIKIGDVEEKSKNQIILKGNFFGSEDSLIFLEPELRYTPENLNSQFQAKAKIGVTLKTSAMTIDVSAPREAADGDTVEYVITYANTSPRIFEDVRINATYPEGFQFESAEPRSPDGNHLWYIGALAEHDTGKISIRGTLDGRSSEVKQIYVVIGSMGQNKDFVKFDEQQKQTKIISSPFSIRQTVNGSKESSVRPGDSLAYTIFFKNDGIIALRNAIVEVKIDTDLLNTSQIKLNKGFFDERSKTITWKAVDEPILKNIAPGQSGVLDFGVSVKGNIPIKTENDRDFMIESVATIDSPDVPTPIGSNKIIASNKAIAKIAGTISLTAHAEHINSPIQDSGPVPPHVDTDTTYTIKWGITNFPNEVHDVEVTSSIPTGVEFTGISFPQGEDLVYNTRTNSIVWKVKKIANGSGIIRPLKEVFFQVKINPQENQVGSEIVLLNSQNVKAIDSFTGKTLGVEGREIKSGTVQSKPAVPDENL